MKFLYTKEKLKDILDQLGNIAEKGEKGEQGIQGERGLKGDKGDTGDSGAKGDAGKDGINGDTVIDANSGLSLKIWTGTQEEYDFIAVKDPNTLYMVR